MSSWILDIEKIFSDREHKRELEEGEHDLSKWKLILVSFFNIRLHQSTLQVWSKFEMSLPFAKLSYVILTTMTTTTTTTRELYGYSNIMRVIIKLFNIRSYLWRYFFSLSLAFSTKKANIYIILYSERKKSVDSFFLRRLWRVKIAKFLWQLALFSHKFGIS